MRVTDRARSGDELDRNDDPGAAQSADRSADDAGVDARWDRHRATDVIGIADTTDMDRIEQRLLACRPDCGAG